MARIEKELGNDAWKSGKYDMAINHFSNALKDTADDDVDTMKILYSNRSASFLKLKRLSEAKADALRCATLDPKWFKAYLRKGEALHVEGSYSEALSAYEEALSLSPDDDHRSISDKIAACQKELMALKEKDFGNEAWRLGDYQKAIDHFTTGIGYSHENSVLKVLYSNRSDSYLKLNQLSSALADASKCISIDSAWAKGYIRKGDVFIARGSLADAAASYEAALKLEPENKTVTDRMTRVWKMDPSKSKSLSDRKGELNMGHYRVVGGTEEGVQKLTRAFYRKLFADPVLSCMFANREPYHAQRLAWLLMEYMGVSNIYSANRGGRGRMHPMHNASKPRTERSYAPAGAGRPGGNFTHTQAALWKQYFLEACQEEFGMRGGLLGDFEDFVDWAMQFYGPFDKDRDK